MRAGRLALGAAAVVGLALTGAAVHAATTDTPPPRTHWMRTPCPTTEFATNCAYNGEVRGGHSYYAVTRKVEGLDGTPTGRRVQCIYYPERKLDREFSACHMLPKGADR